MKPMVSMTPSTSYQAIPVFWDSSGITRGGSRKKGRGGGGGGGERERAELRLDWNKSYLVTMKCCLRFKEETHCLLGAE